MRRQMPAPPPLDMDRQHQCRGTGCIHCQPHNLLRHKESLCCVSGQLDCPSPQMMAPVSQPFYQRGWPAAVAVSWQGPQARAAECDLSAAASGPGVPCYWADLRHSDTCCS
jgi:hypothetical protein